MRRGLIGRSPAELPDQVLQARLDRIRAAMGNAHYDALVIYTNITRAAGVSWLTGFVPYWSEALLIVPREEPPYLVAALTFRVKTWIERTSRIGEVLHTPRVGLKAGQQIAVMQKQAIVGVVDLDGLPAGIAEDLHEGGPGLTLKDASVLFAALRAKADPAEISLAAKAAMIARDALTQARGENLGSLIASVERQARLAGAEEIYLAAAPDLARDARLMRIEGEPNLGKSYALRATLAYRGTWVRLVRTFCESAMARQAAARLAAAVAQLPEDRGFVGFGSWLVEGCRMAQPLDPLIGSPFGAATPPLPGELVSVQGALTVDGHTVLVGAPALIGGRAEAASLLIDPSWD
jgi:hypothetical protein